MLALLAALATLAWRAQRGPATTTLEPAQRAERDALPRDEAPAARVALGPSDSGPVATPAPAAESEVSPDEALLGELRGRVELEDGRTVGAGIEVIAWSDRESPSPELAIRARRGDGQAIAAETNDLGEFVLRGLEPTRLYTAAAAGGGYASPGYVNHLRAGATDVRIVVERAYAAWIRLREEGGQPIRTSTLMYDRRYGTLRGGSDSQPRLGSGSPQVALLLRLRSPLESTLRDRFCVLTSPADEATLGPLELTIDYPGYEPKTASFSIPALGESGPADVMIELRPLTSDWTTLELRFDWPLASFALQREHVPFAILQLFDESGRSCGFAVRDSFPTRVEIEGLPAGEYTWDLQRLTGDSFFAGSPTERGLRLDVPRVSLDLDLSELGGIALRVLRSDGSAYHGRLIAKAQRHGAPDDPGRGFHDAPYAFGGLVPGVYEVWVDEPRFLDRTRDTARKYGATVSVEAGRMSEVELRLAE